jgi:hypothetical protein
MPVSSMYLRRMNIMQGSWINSISFSIEIPIDLDTLLLLGLQRLVLKQSEEVLVE